MKKKLSKAARKKEATGINVEAAKKREAKLEKRIDILEIRADAAVWDLQRLYNILFKKKSQPKRGKGK